MRRPARSEPKADDEAPRATVVAARPPRGEYSDLVDLARRMSIPDDDAIRLVDRAMRLPATDQAPDHR